MLPGGPFGLFVQTNHWFEQESQQVLQTIFNKRDWLEQVGRKASAAVWSLALL
jgi:hypothetical protein